MLHCRDRGPAPAGEKGIQSMNSGRKILTANGGFLTDTYRSYGLIGCARKILAAIRMNVPLLVLRRRTNRSVGAYFDLITDDGRMFYGDNFHFGLFHTGAKSLEEGLDAHTDLAAEMARLDSTKRVLDVGCGICAPAVRIAQRYNCHITGINISREQVRHGKRLVEARGMSNLIEVSQGNALDLDFEENSFDSILLIEVAGDICVKAAQKKRLVGELHRVLKPGGYIGFSDLVFKGRPTREEEKSMRTILYHEGRELITDWPSLFRNQGFLIERSMDLIEETMNTWDHSLAVYEEKSEEVEKRYGRRIAASSLNHLRRIPDILKKHGSFVVMSVTKPL